MEDEDLIIMLEIFKRFLINFLKNLKFGKLIFVIVNIYGD